MRDRRELRLAAAIVASLLFALSSPCLAQAGLDHLEDATLPPRGLLRLRAIVAWTRFDELFSDSGGTKPLGGYLTTDSLGVQQMPSLAPTQGLVTAASGQTFKLTLGESRLNATAREEILPIALEYGITSRFAVTFVTPIIRRRVATVFTLDSNTFGANVGPNPQRSQVGASQNNALVQNEFETAASQLQARLSSCQSNPGGAGCASLLPRQAEAQQLILSSQAFAATLADLYGSSTSDGSPFVPITQSSAQLAIAGRVAAFNAQYQDFLATSSNLMTTVPSAAAGPAGTADVTDYLVGELGQDSLATQARVTIGDIEIGAKALLVNRRPTSTSKTSMLLSVASSVRLPTGTRQRTNQVFDLSSGGGSVVVDARAFLDVNVSRLGLFAAATYAASVHDVDTSTVAIRNSSLATLQVEPRWHISAPIALYGAYTYRAANNLGNDQLVGAGILYSTLATYRDGGRLPVEMRFTHLEAVTGDPNQPKFFRDQVEVRLYFRLH